jgi:CRP/FNR family cyclic AMP-dependent transcriptional regulator
MRHKELDPTIKLLRQVPGLGGCSDAELRRLAPLVDVAQVTAGHLLTKEGAVGHQSFVILEGQAEVIQHGDVVATVGPGQFVGEMAMLDDQPRTATVRARTGMRLLVVGPQCFETFVQHPGVGRRMASVLAQRLRRLENAPANPPPVPAEL